jgi:hypothetical protein
LKVAINLMGFRGREALRTLYGWIQRFGERLSFGQCGPVLFAVGTLVSAAQCNRNHAAYCVGAAD